MDTDWLAAERLAHTLGIGPLHHPTPCHGYQNGCPCPTCRQHAEDIATYGFRSDGQINYRNLNPHPTQPWEQAA